MEVPLSKIDTNAFDVREKVDEEHIKEIAQSLEEDGQWNPVIVRPGDDGTYEMIAGHSRHRAAQRLGWKQIEATVKDVGDDRANELALKTNLKRKGMDKIEEGKVVNQMLEEYDLSESELADQLGKSQRWVNERVRVALDLDPKVKGLVQEGELSYNIARIVTQVEKEDQLEFAELLMAKDVTNVAEASRVKRRFLNDTIYTVGYKGKSFDDSVSKLDENDIDMVLDIRGSVESNYKPEFNGDILSDRLSEHGINYRHESDLGVHWTVRQPYKDGVIDHECFEDWYSWWVSEQADIVVEQLATEIEEEGRTALLCIEQYAEPQDEQNHYCHRHFLADRLQNIEGEHRQMFPNRVDI